MAAGGHGSFDPCPSRALIAAIPDAYRHMRKTPHNNIKKNTKPNNENIWNLIRKQRLKTHVRSASLQPRIQAAICSLALRYCQRPMS